MSVVSTLNPLTRVNRGLHRGLRRVLGSNLSAGTRQAQVIAVAAQKGGVGKTTTAVHVAAGLALFHNRKVLLIDMDGQGHVGASLHSSLGEDADESLGSLLLDKKRDLFEIAKTTQIENLWTVSSDTELHQTEAQLSGRIGKELVLKKALATARTHFDVIIVDCPPNLGSLTVNALVAADQVLVPCDLSILGLDGVDGLIDALETVADTLNPSLEILGLVRTRVDRRNVKVNATIEEKLAGFGDLLFETAIGASTSIVKAQLDGEPVFSFDPKGRASENYAALCAEIDARLFEVTRH